MENIQFDEEQQYQPTNRVVKKPFFVRVVLATGIVSTERQANYVLLGVAILLILVAILIFPYSQSGTVLPTTMIRPPGPIIGH